MKERHAHGLFLHGMVLVVAGLLMGMVVQAVANPRMGLSAHVGAIMNGTLLLGMGAFWPSLALAPSVETLGWWLMIAGSYLSSGSVFLAGAFGTSESTPLHGAGHAGAAWQEALVTAGLVVGAVAVLAGCGIALWGLARRRG